MASRRGSGMDVWVNRDLDGGEFPDQRLRLRLGKILGDLGRRIGSTLPAACQEWAATKPAYRFFSNPRVDEGVILGGRSPPSPRPLSGTLLPSSVSRATAPTRSVRISLIKGRHATHTVGEVLMHSSLALTTGVCRWTWRPSSFGPARSPRAPTR